MSIYLKGYISENNEDYQKHKAVLEACENAGIEKLPEETAKFFGSEYVESYLLEEKLETEIIKHEYNTDDSVGFEVFMSEIPKEVHKLRFEFA